MVARRNNISRGERYKRLHPKKPMNLSKETLCFVNDKYTIQLAALPSTIQQTITQGVITGSHLSPEYLLEQSLAHLAFRTK